jgi:hypothetical protein
MVTRKRGHSASKADENTPHKKDIWDKAQIISGFVASVVIAGVGLLITSSIQKAQIISADKNAQAQVAVAERNADAQLALAAKNATAQEQIEESKLTGALAEHLISGNSLEKQIAIVALQRSVPSDMYQTIIIFLVTADSDPDVAVPRGIYYLSSSSFHEVALENSPFTPLLIKGLNGAAALDGNGVITFDGLAHYIQREMIALNGMQHPMWVVDDTTSRPAIIFSHDAEFSKIIAVVVANADYNDKRQPPLPDVKKQAQMFGSFIQSKEAKVNYIIDEGSAAFLAKMADLKLQSDANTLLIVLYTGGSATSSSDGASSFVFVDGSALSAAEFVEPIRSIPAKMRIVFVDSCDAPGAPAAKL